MKQKKERGAAQINVELSDGVVTVRHTTVNGEILMVSKAYDGYWGNLWRALESKEFGKVTRRAK